MEGRIVHNVARAYIDGLERDRSKLHEMEQHYDRQVWELIQISAYAKALYTALHQFRQAAENGVLRAETLERIDDLLAADRRVYFDIWACECGHHRYDHDEDGRCLFFGCRHICGPNKERS